MNNDILGTSQDTEPVCSCLISRHIYPSSKQSQIVLIGIRHFQMSYVTYFFAALGRFAPYLERACILFATPAVSSVPLMMW